MGPDLLVANYAPTAMVAARGLGFPVALDGTGFSSPPRIAPIPAFRTWEPIPIDRVVRSEHLVVASINRVLLGNGRPPLWRLADLFEVEEDFLCTVPELDHYTGRVGQRYWAPVLADVGRVQPVWPEGGRPRVFAYLRSEHPGIENVLAALRDADLIAVTFVHDLSPSLRKRWRGPELVLSDQAFDLNAALAQADLFVGHGGHDTTFRALLAGVPLLLLPRHAEQLINALNVKRLGAGLLLPEQAGAADIRQSLHHLMGEASFRTAARHFAARQADYDPGAALEAVVSRCEELLA